MPWNIGSPSEKVASNANQCRTFGSESLDVRAADGCEIDGSEFQEDGDGAGMDQGFARRRRLARRRSQGKELLRDLSKQRCPSDGNAADAVRVDAAILRQGRGESWLLLLFSQPSVIRQWPAIGVGDARFA